MEPEKINPTDEIGQAFIMEMKAALAVALVLYDNFLVGIDPFESDPQLRRKIDQDRKEIRGHLNEIADNYYAWSNRILMEKALELFNREQSWMNSEDAEEFLSSELGQKVISSEHRRYLDTLIKGSLSYENLSDLNLLQVYFNRARKRHDHWPQIPAIQVKYFPKRFFHSFLCHEAHPGSLPI